MVGLPLTESKRRSKRSCPYAGPTERLNQRVTFSIENFSLLAVSEKYGSLFFLRRGDVCRGVFLLFKNWISNCINWIAQRASCVLLAFTLSPARTRCSAALVSAIRPLTAYFPFLHQFEDDIRYSVIGSTIGMEAVPYQILASSDNGGCIDYVTIQGGGIANFSYTVFFGITGSPSISSMFRVSDIGKTPCRSFPQKRNKSPVPG